MIHLENAALGYAGRIVADNVSFSLAAGSLTAVHGPNGGGKTTLLNTLVGNQAVQRGLMTVALPPTRIGYLPQQSGVDRRFPFTVFDFVSTGLWHQVGLQRSIERSGRATVAAALQKAGLTSLARSPLARLSGGQWQRARFARLIAQNSPLILLDEPFTSVDEHTTLDLLNLILQWHCQGRTILAVLHDRHQILQHFPQSLLFGQGNVTLGASAMLLAHKQAPRQVA